MRDINTEITDTYGDTLTIRANKDGFELFDESGQTNPGDFYFDQEQARDLRDLLNEFLGEDVIGYTPENVSPNEAKLRLAAELGLRAKFSYRGERDYRAVERRLTPDSVYESGNSVIYVAGESYDAGGEPEGYRQFRLDRISGEVVVR